MCKESYEGMSCPVSGDAVPGPTEGEVVLSDTEDGGEKEKKEKKDDEDEKEKKEKKDAEDKTVKKDDEDVKDESVTWAKSEEKDDKRDKGSSPKDGE